MSLQKAVAVIGANGGIGGALVDRLSQDDSIATIYSFSRTPFAHASKKVVVGHIDIEDESTMKEAAAIIDKPLAAVIVATGLLHQPGVRPEKAASQMNSEALVKLFSVNAVGPALVAKHFLPKLTQDHESVFAALSARVGSISDNRLGGWYAYRASKAALNMIIKTLSIEYTRRLPKSIIVGLHPGTVDTSLSKPFQKNVPDHKLFTNEQSADYLLKVVGGLSVADTGLCFAWDGSLVPA